MPLITLQSAKGYGWGSLPLSVPNSFESIQTVTVGTTAQSSITFSSIPSTYKHLQIRGIMRNTANSGGGAEEQLRIRANSDSANNYRSHAIIGNGSSISSWDTGTSSGENAHYLPGYGAIPMSNAPASTYGVCVIDLLDYSSTNKTKVMRALIGAAKHTSTTSYSNFAGSYWNSTTAINSLELFPQAGSFIQYSQFALYGIKG